jgi:NADPH-dependent ferric siderophore reductase
MSLNPSSPAPGVRLDLPSLAGTDAAAARSSAGRPGLLGQGLLRLLTHRATVGAVHELSATLRLVSLRSESFRALAGVPGDKVQLRVSGMSFRTFTPFRLGGAADELHLLGHVHGGGPGSDWLGGVTAGEPCHVLGPRRSLDLAGIQRSTVFFGDETSLGLARALCSTPLGAVDTHFIFETGDPYGMRQALEALGEGMLRNAWLVERRAVDAHLPEIEAALARYAAADAYRQYVLSGRAPAIQRLVRGLRAAGARPSQVLAKAYWAPGKVGLD